MYGISLGCMSCGALASDTVDAIRRGHFWNYYRESPIAFWITIPVTALVIYLLVRQGREVFRSRPDPSVPKERAGVGHSLIGFTFHTTAFVRFCVYVGFYIIGISFAFM